MTKSTKAKAPSDTDPREWAMAMEDAFGEWEDLLDDPDELDERAAWLRAGADGAEPDTALEDLIQHLYELIDDPDRLEARAASLRAATAAIAAAEAKWGPVGAAFMDGTLTEADLVMVAAIKAGRDPLFEG